MTIRKKIIGAALGNALLVAVVGLVGAIDLLRSGSVFSKMDRVELREVDDTGQIARTAAQLHSAFDAYIASTLRGETNQRKVYTTPIESDFAQIDDSIARMEERMRHESGDALAGFKAAGTKTDEQHIDLMKRGSRSARMIWKELSSSLESNPITPDNSTLVARVGEAIQSLTDATMDFQRTASADMMRVVERENKRAAFSVKFLEAVSIMALLFALLLGWGVAGRLARRLSKLKEATGKIGAGDLETHIDLESEDEIGQLAKSFNEMADGLRRSRDEGRKSDLNFRELTEVIREVFWMSDASCSKITYVSPAYEDLWGMSRESLYKDARSFTQGIVPDDLDRVVVALNNIGTLNEEYRIIRPDGTMRWIHARGFGVRNETGEVERVVGIAADVTNQKMAEDALRGAQAELEDRVETRTAELQLVNDALRRNEVDLENTKNAAEAASRAKSEFLARMSHEIRTPLNGVIGMADLLLGSGLTLEQTSYAELTKSSADALLRLVSDILDFSKIEAGKLELEQISFEIHGIIESTVSMLAAKAAGKGIELASFVDLGVPTLLIGDPDRLRQILINLVNNALKFTEHGQVTIRVTVERSTNTLPDSQKWLRFDVQDTGIGISAERLDRLFKPFSQVDSSTTRQYGGTGLGLAICRELTDLMHGTMGVSSEFGKGSTFWFIVPFADVTAESAATPVPANADPTGLPVLVVSGREVQREIICDQLASMDMRPIAASTVDDAMTSLHDSATAGSPIPVVIVDASLPESNDTISARIQSDVAIGETTLLLLTPAESPLESNALQAAGFAAQVAKPVRQSRISDQITDAMAQAHSATGLPVPGESSALSGMAAPQRPIHVLLVEDNIVNQKVATKYLERAGYSCDLVRNGQLAVEALAKAHAYDLVLMDCQMPVMDGFEATRMIRAAEAARRSSGHIPIIALTANAIKGDRETCLDAGMDDYLTKPLNAAVMIQTIQRTLERLATLKAESTTLAESQPPESQAEESKPDCEAPETTAEILPPLDYESALGYCNRNLAFFLEIVGDFETQAAGDLSNMTHALQDANANGVAQAAHNLKGAAAYLCAESLRSHAEELEQAAKSNTLDSGAAMIHELKNEVERCVLYAQARTAHAAGPIVKGN